MSEGVRGKGATVGLDVVPDPDLWKIFGICVRENDKNLLDPDTVSILGANWKKVHEVKKLKIFRQCCCFLNKFLRFSPSILFQLSSTLFFN